MGKNYSRQTNLEELSKDLQQLARPLLNADDRVITCFSSETGPSGGDWLWSVLEGPPDRTWSALILTEQHILRCHSSNRYGGHAEAVRLIDVVNVTGSLNSRKDQVGEQYDLAVAYAGDNKIWFYLYSHELGRQCLNLLRQAVQQAKASAAADPVSPPSLTIVDRLRRLTDLHRENLITDDEFTAKRDEILGEL